MKGLFSYDSPVVQSLMTIGDCICLSVLWIVFSLPLVTVGASTTALYAAAYHHIRMKEGHGLWRAFWDAFKENFKRSTLVWLAVLAVMTLLTVDVFVLRSIRLSGGTMGVLYAPALVLWCAALAPDMEYDKNGCFSGSAIELPDGRQLLMYTGVRQVREENGDLRDRQTQCLTIGDGVDYEKLDANPVISARDLPEGGSYVDFRDPKIWREGDTYYVVVGDRPADGSGSILLYESKDCRTWTYDGVLAACHNQYGQMWECPDFFFLDGKHVLLTSPQEMTVIGLEFHAGNGTVCLIGEYDRVNHHLIRENVQAIDYGLDFYAPQTLETPTAAG